MAKSTTKLGWLVKIKSIQDLKLSEMWVGSFISPYLDVQLSTLAPSGVVLCFIGRTPFIKFSIKVPNHDS